MIAQLFQLLGPDAVLTFLVFTASQGWYMVFATISCDEVRKMYYTVSATHSADGGHSHFSETCQRSK